METGLYEMYLEKYLEHLKQEERSEATRSQYRRELLRFLSYLEGREMTRETVIAYKLELEKLYEEKGYAGVVMPVSDRRA